MRAAVVSGLLAALLLCCPRDADAQASDQKAVAEHLFEEGRARLVEKDYAAACPKLAESQRLDPSIGTALYLAACYEKLGKTASAWALFREAEELAAREGDAKRASLARARADALAPTLSKLVIVVPESARVPGLTVVRDGTRVGEPIWGAGVPIDPGAHVVEVTAPDKQPFRVSVDVSAPLVEVVVPILENVSHARRRPPRSPCRSPRLGRSIDRAPRRARGARSARWASPSAPSASPGSSPGSASRIERRHWSATRAPRAVIPRRARCVARTPPTDASASRAWMRHARRGGRSRSSRSREAACSLLSAVSSTSRRRQRRRARLARSVSRRSSERVAEQCSWRGLSSASTRCWCPHACLADRSAVSRRMLEPRGGPRQRRGRWRWRRWCRVSDAAPSARRISIHDGPGTPCARDALPR